MKKMILIMAMIFIISGCGPTSTSTRPSRSISIPDPLGIEAGDDIDQDQIAEMYGPDPMDDLDYCDWHDCPTDPVLNQYKEDYLLEEYLSTDPEPNHPQEPDYYDNSPVGASLCPQGCEYHQHGCDIKGNVSFESRIDLPRPGPRVLRCNHHQP